jgi:hypothetical protein
MLMVEGRVSELVTIDGFSFVALASPGTEPRARRIAERCGRGHRFLTQALGFDADLRLLMLAPEHWEQFTGSPMFGVPQTIDERTVVVAGENAELWQMVVPPLESLPAPAAEALRRVYGQPDGSINIASHMDLLPVHEVGHLFVDQAAGGFDFHQPRRWLVELFCNLALYAYAVAEEPDQLENLETFSRVTAKPIEPFPHQALADFDRVYADMDPPNFVWYLSRLDVAARQPYAAAGPGAVPALYRFIVQSKDGVPDDRLAEQLAGVHPKLADVLLSWPR